MSGTRQAVVTNPLGLDVEWRSGIQPLHEAFDAARLDALRASMEANGWQGPPLVCDRELREANQDRAYTGTHRIEAWADVQGDRQAPMPCVYIEDICEAHGIDWAALLEEHGSDCEAVTAVIYQLPADVCEGYGLDTGGV